MRVADSSFPRSQAADAINVLDLSVPRRTLLRMISLQFARVTEHRIPYQ